VLERQDRVAHDRGGFGGRHGRTERVAQTPDGARVQLRDARLVDADLGANLLHRRLAVVIEADDFLLTRRERRDRRAHACLRLLALVGAIGLLGLGGNQCRRQRRFVQMFVVGER